MRAAWSRKRRNRLEYCPIPQITGAHANYCRDDFVFPRTQSRAMREARWAGRIGRMWSWSEIIAAGLLTAFAGIVLLISASLTKLAGNPLRMRSAIDAVLSLNALQP